MRKPKMISGLSQENSIIANTWNPESNCTRREKNHFLFRWSASTLPEQHTRHLMFCWRKYWRLLERGWRKRIVWCMDRIHKIRSTNGKATRRIRLVRGETRKQRTSRPDVVWPDMWKLMSDAAKKKAKQRWDIEKPKLDNARQLRGIFFIEPNDEEFKLTMKSARRKLDAPMPAAMLAKYQ